MVAVLSTQGTASCVAELMLLAYACSVLKCLRLQSSGESRNVGEKGHKTLLELVLPRLAQYEVVPATLVAQLLQIIGTTDDK